MTVPKVKEESIAIETLEIVAWVEARICRGGRINIMRGRYPAGLRKLSVRKGVQRKSGLRGVLCSIDNDVW